MAQHDPTRLTAVTQAALVDDPEFLRELVQQALQTLLEAEMEAHLGASRYERTPERRGYRNGYKPRQLQTRVGTLDLLVPQDRDGSFSTDLFGRYQRSEQALVLTLMEMYLQGVSTRKVATITEQLCGTRFSKSQVSTLTVPGTRLRVRCPAPSLARATVDGGCLSLPDRGCALRKGPARWADRQSGCLAGQRGA